MAQFNVYENGNMETSALHPYLLDVQADILGELPTRIVSARQRISGKKPIPSCSLNWRSRDNGFTCRQPSWPGSAKISWAHVSVQPEHREIRSLPPLISPLSVIYEPGVS